MKERLTEALELLRTFVLGVFGYILLKSIYLSVRWEFAGPTPPESLNELGRGKIISFWHGRQLMMSFSYAGRGGKPFGNGIFALISRHRDGRAIAFAVRLLGIQSVAGSSTRGGKEASLELIKKVRDGFDAAITPDGPRGPRCEAKAGVVVLAKGADAPIYPMSFSTSRYWRFKSWDKMILPKPFSRGVFYIGEPMNVPTDVDKSDLKKYQDEITTRLTAVDEAADSYFAESETAYV